MYPHVTQLDTRSTELRAELELIRQLRPRRQRRAFPSLRFRRARHATCPV